MNKSGLKNLKQLKGNWTVAEIEISYKPIITEQQKITSSSAAYDLVQTLWDKESIYLQEQFAVLFLNNYKKLIGWRIISTGTMTKCIVDIKLLVSLALHCMATDVIIIHNHPSGNLNASQFDRSLTETIRDALKLIDVCLMDHLIITDTAYFSFRDEGIL